MAAETLGTISNMGAGEMTMYTLIGKLCNVYIKIKAQVISFVMLSAVKFKFKKI